MLRAVDMATCDGVAEGISGGVSGEMNCLTLPLSKTAFEKTRRCGGPASVVDPLLALVISLRRLEELVLSVLESLGFQGNELGLHCGGSKGPEGSSSLVTDDTFFEKLPPIDRYILAHRARGRGEVSACGVSQEARKTCIEAICRWVDEVSPFDKVSRVATSRGELVSQVAASAAALTDGDNVASVSERGRKRQRSVDFADKPDAFARSHWQHYATQLRAGYRAERTVLKALCATDLGKGLRFQAKLAFAEKDRAETGIIMPVAAALRKNHEILKLSKDALADYQRRVTVLLSSLEDVIDDYVDQVRNVAEREEVFWHNLRLAERESEALLDLSRHIERCC